MVAVSITTYYADAVYIVNGYSYNIINNKAVALCGWDNSSPELIVPDVIGGRYVAAIADYGFEYNDSITSVDFLNASQLNYIGIDAFRECTALSAEITIPETVTSMGERAFQGCSSIPSIVMNANVDTIPKQCFYQCTSLETAILHDSLTTINGFAFADCSSLMYVELPSSVISIAASAFRNDPNLTLGVWYNSYAYQYAKDNSISYVLLDGVKLGDASGDGSVNINDVTTIQRHLAELETLEGIYLHAADANQDGTVDIADATIIQMYLAEYEMEYPIGEVMTQ